MCHWIFLLHKRRSHTSVKFAKETALTTGQIPSVRALNFYDQESFDLSGRLYTKPAVDPVHL
jgi:hypothetical protein